MDNKEYMQLLIKNATAAGGWQQPRHGCEWQHRLAQRLFE